MHDDAVKKFERIHDLIDQGKLPESAIPRLFYIGHNVVCCIGLDARKYKCASCGREDSSQPDHCECGSDEVFDITHEREAEWECVKCKHQWIAEDGTKCPACGAVKKK